jgi:hypothetical protein
MIDFEPKTSTRMVEEREDGMDGWIRTKTKLIGRQRRGWSGWRGGEGTRMRHRE